MSVGPRSRYLFSPLFHDDLDQTNWLLPPDYVGYAGRQDDALYITKQGDTLWSIAQAFYDDANLWWVVADYQPDPILDPTLEFQTGRLLRVPSRTFVEGHVLSTTARRPVLL